MRIWRLSLARFADQAFTGRGSLKSAARWHPIGTTLVYTSGSLALAALEFFVNWSRRSAPEPLVAIPADTAPDVSVLELEHRRLPSGWRAQPVHPATQQIGAAWIKSGASAILSVPSVIIPQERNCLLNPTHGDFKKIRIGKPEPFSFDPRMWK
ncbi:MAG TPA: RES family NAD+ phosphorylase [Bryobacteraceae bacterium]|jgi:RES domain-containing protein|nr:RES family NAD+ phosphorylase [Bryobacteraceae bacterium]